MHRCTRLIVLSLAGTQVCLRVPLRSATGKPCDRLKYLVLALKAFQAAPQNIEAGAAQLQEVARQPSRAFVPRTTLKRLFASLAPAQVVQADRGVSPPPDLCCFHLPPSLRGALRTHYRTLHLSHRTCASSPLAHPAACMPSQGPAVPNHPSESCGRFWDSFSSDQIR